MYPLKTQYGKFYIGKIEVEATPVYIGLETTIGVEGDKFPQLEIILFELLNDLGNKIKEDTEIDLNKANAYRAIVYDRREIPEIHVADGIVSSKNERHVLIDFYKVRPKLQDKIESSFSEPVE